MPPGRELAMVRMPTGIYGADQDLRRAMAWATAASSVVVESSALLSQLSDFARNRVEARARILEGAMKAHSD
jgi:hypothetical protein